MLEILREIGPLSWDDWAAEYVRRKTEGRDPLRRARTAAAVEGAAFWVLRDPRITGLGDDVFEHITDRCEGLSLAHRLTKAEIATGAVPVYPDWPHARLVGAEAGVVPAAVVVRDAKDFKSAAVSHAITPARAAKLDVGGGGRLLVFRDRNAFKQFAPGDVVGLHWGEGELTVQACRKEPSAADAAPGFLRFVAAACEASSFGTELERVLVAYLADGLGELETNPPPLGEILSAGGFAGTQGGFIKEAATTDTDGASQ